MKIVTGVGRAVGPVEGLLGTALKEREKRKGFQSALAEVLEQQEAQPEPAPAPMPLRNDKAVSAARRKSAAEQKRRRGRASTILSPLSSEDEGLGG